MWAAPPLQPLKSWPPNTISAATTKPPLRRRSMAVSNNMKNREEKMGGGDLNSAQAIIAALKASGPQQQLGAAESKTKTIPSGADVLKALERVTAQKAKKEEKKRGTRAVSEKRENQGAPCSFDNVRSLCIKPEWGDRLENLERRLKQLGH